MKKILFTEVGRRIELIQAYRSAAIVLNKDIRIYGGDISLTASALSYCDFLRQILPIRDPNYIDGLLEICRNDKIDLIIPTIDTGLVLLAENKERFEAIGTKILISTPEMIRICRDKNETAQFFVKCGLHAPITVNDWKEYTSGFPAFIKPKDGSSSINAYKVENAEELEIYATKIKDYVIQPFVPGKEFTIDIFCDWDGNPLSIVPRERLQIRAGEVLKTKICMDQAMIEESRALCKVFKPCGPMTVQLIRDKNGVDWFIEINPRYGGGAPLSMKAGGKTAEIVLKLLDNEAVEEQHIVDGAIYSRFDQSVCVEENIGRIKGVIFDLDDTLYSEKEYVRSGFKAVSDYLGGGYESALWQYFTEKKPAITELLKERGMLDKEQKCLDVYRSHMPDIHLYSGVKEMIYNLRSKGIKVGVLTDGRPTSQRNKLEILGVADLVDDVIVTDELGGVQFRKPCDIAFRILKTRWRLYANEIMYVGDNPAKDFQASLQLGIKCCYFHNCDSIYYGEDVGRKWDAEINDISDVAQIVVS